MAPFSSEAQREWAYAEKERARRAGKKPPIDADEWERATEREHKKLPQHAKEKSSKEDYGLYDWRLGGVDNSPKKNKKSPDPYYDNKEDFDVAGVKSGLHKSDFMLMKAIAYLNAQ